MKRLYAAKDLIEAQLVKDFLDDHHIESVVLGGYLGGAAGELPAMQFPEVWVLEESDLPQGRELLDQFTDQNRDDMTHQQPWCCGECGERIEAQFDICWKCGAMRV